VGGWQRRGSDRREGTFRLGLGELPLLPPPFSPSSSFCRYELQEKYKENGRHPLVANAKAPPSLYSIPLELLDAIISLLPGKDRFSLSAVSFGVLARISPSLYSGGRLFLGYDQLSRFIAGRVRPFFLNFSHDAF